MIENPFGNLFIAISDRITAKVPEVRYIDQDLAQLEDYDMRPAVSWPCVLIDVSGFVFSEAGSQPDQLGTGEVILRLGLPPNSQANNLAPLAYREKALSFYETEQKIYAALHGWAPAGFSRLLRRSVKTERREDALRVREMVFAISYNDQAAEPVYQSVPKPNITMKVNLRKS